MLTKASQRISESLFLCHYFIPTYSKTAHLTSKQPCQGICSTDTNSSKAQPTDKEAIVMVISAQYSILQPFFFRFRNPICSNAVECFVYFVPLDSSLSPSSQTVNFVLQQTTLSGLLKASSAWTYILPQQPWRILHKLSQQTLKFTSGQRQQAKDTTKRRLYANISYEGCLEDSLSIIKRKRVHSSKKKPKKPNPIW